MVLEKHATHLRVYGSEVWNYRQSDRDHGRTFRAGRVWKKSDVVANLRPRTIGARADTVLAGHGTGTTRVASRLLLDVDLWDLLNEDRRRVKVAGRPSLLGDVSIDTLQLLGGYSDR